MPQGGGQSEWQRLQAAQRREAERRAREKTKLAKETYLASQQQAAEDKTADLDRQVRVLDGVLTDSLSCPPLAFQQLKVSRLYLASTLVPWALLLPSRSGLTMRPSSRRASAGCLAGLPGMSVR